MSKNDLVKVKKCPKMDKKMSKNARNFFDIKMPIENFSISNFSQTVW